MHKLDSIETTKRIKGEQPEAAILILNTSEEENFIGLVGLVMPDTY
jgi:DNA-binding NarL/FixJ family response regulator